ncbi:cytochrome c3 family protein [Undibacterium sp. Ji22W]|uniref:cytochrome c3 family protein n=1 Tax=Undibacterium sp. Ji22W TaxID=3413038 RepID=UPI003BF08C70
MLSRYIFISLLLLLSCTTKLAQADIIEKALMPGELSRAHAKYENECSQCHAKFDKNAQTKLCLDCHKPIAVDVQNKTGMHGRIIDNQCKSCHTEHKGRGTKITILDKPHFDHKKTDFPLLGKHKEIQKCESCHIGKAKFREASMLCNDCHQKIDHDKGHRGSLGKQCENCHNETTWKETKFDHEKTKFSLLGGKHKEVKCQSCHIDRIYNTAPKDCYSCHKQDDQDKGHKGRFSTKCDSCHSDKGWKTIKFNHNIDTQYPLKGKHLNSKCDSCHTPERGNVFRQKLSSKCVDCHKKDDQDKGHKGVLGEKCDSCHNERGWKTTSFDHDTTHFPLRDKHQDAKCDSCHIGGVSGKNAKLKLEKDCVSCHRKDDQSKGHKGRYGSKCESCHTEKAWKASTFNHNRETKFILKDKHLATKCDACHVVERGQLYQASKLSAACVSCHKKDDQHKNQLGEKCETCHNEKRWQDAPYDHNKSIFALTGSHARTNCKNCHLTPAFHDAPKTCLACHQKDNPHQRRFGEKCESCHYTGTWSSWDFDHDTTKFKLDGGHQKVSCYGCHSETLPNPAKPGKLCVSCHAKDDAHDGGFGAQCDRCHTSTNWKKAKR